MVNYLIMTMIAWHTMVGMSAADRVLTWINYGKWSAFLFTIDAFLITR